MSSLPTNPTESETHKLEQLWGSRVEEPFPRDTIVEIYNTIIYNFRLHSICRKAACLQADTLFESIDCSAERAKPCRVNLLQRPVDVEDTLLSASLQERPALVKTRRSWIKRA